MAVNERGSPEQICPVGLAAMLTAGVTLAFTVIVITLLIAVGMVLHWALLVITHSMVDPVVSVEVVNVALLVPTGLPFTRH